jgi:general secretion pathway protein B
MSYILDALRKADAQRQRTRLPGLHAQAPATAAAGSSAAWWRSPIVWALGSVLVVTAVVLAWPASQQPVAVPVPTTAAMQEPASAAPVPVVQAPPPAPVLADAAPAAATAIQPAPPPVAPERHGPVRAMRSTPDRAAVPQARDASTPAPAPTTPVAAPLPAATPRAAPPSAETSSAPPGAPKLAISGGVYSANAAQRLLIVGGQVFNEGSEVAPGVVLEQVRPNQALLNFQGQRYTVRS